MKGQHSSTLYQQLLQPHLSTLFVLERWMLSMSVLSTLKSESGAFTVTTMVFIIIGMMILQFMVKFINVQRQLTMDTNALAHFRSRVDSLRRLLGHKASCMRAFSNLDFKDLAEKTTNVVQIPTLPKNLEMAGVIAGVIDNNLSFQNIVLEEPASNTRSQTTDTASLNIDLVLTAQKQVYLSSPLIKKRIPMYFTLDPNAKLIDCGVTDRPVANIHFPEAQCIHTAGSFQLLDIFADGNLDPFTDGDAIAAITQGVPMEPFIPQGNNRLDPIAYLESIKLDLDIDGNATFDAVDGNMIMMYMFGGSPTQIMSFAPNAPRSSDEVMTYLGELSNRTVPCQTTLGDE